MQGFCYVDFFFIIPRERLMVEEGLKEGIYRIWAEVINEHGARSSTSEKITISVEPLAFLKLSSWAVSLPITIASLIVLILVLLGIIYYIRYKSVISRKRIRKEICEAEDALHNGRYS